MSEPVQKRDRTAEIQLRNQVLEDRHEGWKEFQRTYDRFFRHIVMRFQLTPEDAEEVLQEIYEQLVKSDFNGLRVWRPEECSLTRWVAVIATNVAINYVRSAYHKYSTRKVNLTCPGDPAGDPLDLFAAPTETVEDRIHRMELLRTVDEVIRKQVQTGRLRPEDARLIQLRLSGLNFDEIEKLTGISRSSASSRLTRLKPVLHRLLLDAGLSVTDLG